VVSAKTTSDASKANPFPPDPNSSQSTINTVAREILEAGGSALALSCDVRDFENITTLVDETVRQLGSIDVLVYNSGAIWWSSVENTPMKRFQLMQRINPEGVCSTSTSKGPCLGSFDELQASMAQYKPACPTGRSRIGKHVLLLYRHQFIHASSVARRRMQWVCRTQHLRE
jgi:NAD(P)-dependent dehydrogenase (short-subunit alcohol dehydrogenase family)